MEDQNQPNQVDQSSSMNVVNLQSPDRKVTRRKFVQTTLFPLKPHDSELENSSQKEPKKAQIGGNNDDEEVCGSQGKKKRARKPKESNTTPQKRGSKKVKDDKVENCGQDEVKKDEEVVVDDDDEVEEVCGSQGRKRRGRNLKGNTTPSKRQSRKATANGKDSCVVAIDDAESPDDGSPQQLKGKQRVSAKNGKTTQQISQVVPDLWLEAKKTAEENSRFFAGKQIHPFFSSWKAGKKELETIEVENNECLDRRKQKNVEIGPVHVFENVKDDLDYIDWSNWSFNDSIFSNTICNEERKSSFVKGTVSSVKIDDIPSTSQPYETSPLLKDISLAQLRGADEDSFLLSSSISPIIVDEEDLPNDSVKNIGIGKDFGVRGPCTHGNIGYVSSHLQERIMSYCFNRGEYPENSLWTNKYHPEKALEVCGNNEAVKFMNDWLRLWHATDFRSSKSSCSMNDDSYDSDSDINEEEATGLKNVLLVTGPVGSGKSAAIYACAKEQGFQIIEVNASDWRNGALLKQKFGEAVGSHWIKRSQESPMGKRHSKSSPVFTSEAAAQDLNNGVAKVISLLEEDSVGNLGSQYHSDGRLSCDRGNLKTLILFEDVDVTLCDDRGFISTIQQLAETGKRPMILTSNNESPQLPDNLTREEVCFTMPSSEELARHMQLVCSAENTNIRPNLVERCVEFCRGDIRKTLMHLQFWCQNRKCFIGGKMRSESCPMMFNLDAGHCLLPKLISWELPSVLSEYVEAEVAKSLSRMEERHSLLGVIKEEEEIGNTTVQNNLENGVDETTSIEAKKEAIINGNCFLHVDNDIMADSNICDFSNSSGSPVAFTRRNIRRKSDTVLSESEDEICNHDKSAVLHSPLKGMTNELSENLLCSGVKEVEEARHQNSETGHVNLFNFFAVDNSCSQSTDPVVHSAEANNQFLEFAHANCSSYGEANDSGDLLDDLLVHARDGTVEVNLPPFPVAGHEKYSTVGSSIHSGEVNGMNMGTGDAANLCLNPLSFHVQQYGEDNVAAKRCLFPHPAHGAPTSLTIGSPIYQSTGQLTHCVEASMAEPNHWHLEMNVNHDGPLVDKLPCCTKDYMENSDHQHPAAEGSNSLCYTALGESMNPSNDQLFHFIEAKVNETQHQHPEAGHRSDNSCAPVYDALNHFSDQYRKIDTPLNTQQQHSQLLDLNYPSCVRLDAPLITSKHLHGEEEKADNIGHQLPDMAISGPAADNSQNPLDGKILMFTESKAEDYQCQYSDATNVNHAIDQCQSIGMSFVPESTFVPETEVDDGTECRPGTDLMEVTSQAVIGNDDSSILGCQDSDYRFCGSDIRVNPTDEEMGDSQSENEHLEPSTSGCPVMDECSRINFFKRSKSLRMPALELKNSVQERWNELRKTDLGQYFLSENKDALHIVELGYRMSNLISEGDLLLSDCELLINDSSGLSDETLTFCWLDQQVQMAFSIARYGYLLYAKDIDALQSKMGLANKLHLGWEMLLSTSNSIALGKLLSLNRSPNSSAETAMKQVETTMETSSMRERKACLQNIVQSVVPLKSCLTVRGNALHDYLSSLAHISRLEASRLAEAAEKCKRRRVRAAKNYLSNSAPDLSQEDILKLTECNFYRRDSADSTHASLR